MREMVAPYMIGRAIVRYDTIINNDQISVTYFIDDVDDISQIPFESLRAKAREKFKS